MLFFPQPNTTHISASLLLCLSLMVPVKSCIRYLWGIDAYMRILIKMRHKVQFHFQFLHLNRFRVMPLSHNQVVLELNRVSYFKIMINLVLTWLLCSLLQFKWTKHCMWVWPFRLDLIKWHSLSSNSKANIERTETFHSLLHWTIYEIYFTYTWKS